MTKTFSRIIILAIVLIAIAVGASALVLSGGCSQTGNAAIDNAKNGAINAIIDTSGIKERIDAEVRSKAGAVAEQTGVPQTLVDNVIDSLAIPDWEATTLPSGATEAGTYDIETESLSARVTIYDDPSVVTVNAYGQTITMAVPESAQGYLSLIGYLG